ncbi:MAG: hypothetical protein IH609_17795 [Dehalococcoidia bacterium]|nr:hypothetical protein [Dehalococcoidia bacterium]
MSFQPGPRPYESILVCPHKNEIDQRLFVRRLPVRKVHRWLTEEMAVQTISYATLNRYKNAEALLRSEDDDDLRRAELKRDLAYLRLVVKRGRKALEDGLLVRPAEAIRAVEMRSHILALFGDGGEKAEKRHQAQLQRVASAVLSVVSEEQRVAIVDALGDDAKGEETGS